MISGVVLGIVTATLLGVFVAIALWAYAPGRKDAFARAAQLPFADEGGES